MIKKTLLLMQMIPRKIVPYGLIFLVYFLFYGCLFPNLYKITTPYLKLQNLL
jgi:hypothetical protein